MHSVRSTGTHTAFVCLLVYIIGQKRTLCKPVILASIAGYVLNVAAVGLILYDAARTTELGYDDWNATAARSHIFAWENFVYYLALVISDCVQLWRTRVICSPPRFVFYPLLFLLVVSILGGFADSVDSFVALYKNYNPLDPDPVVAKISADLDLVWLLPSILLNMVCTVMVFYRIQKHMDEWEGSNRSSSNRLRYYQRLSALFIETGVLFTCVELLYLVLNLVAEYAVNSNDSVYAALVAIRPSVSIIAGAYPLSVTLYAHLAKSLTQAYTSNFSLHFTEQQSHQQSASIAANTSSQPTGVGVYGMMEVSGGKVDRSRSNTHSETASEEIAYADPASRSQKNVDIPEVV